MKYIPQLELTDDEFEVLQAAAAAADMGVYDYVLSRAVGRPPRTARPPKEPGFPPAMETKADAAHVE